MRWMVTETPGKVSGSTPQQVLSDETHVPLRASVRDKKYDTVSGATVRPPSRGPTAARMWSTEAGSARARHLYGRIHGRQAGHLRGRNRPRARTKPNSGRTPDLPPRRRRGREFRRGAEQRPTRKALERYRAAITTRLPPRRSCRTKSPSRKLVLLRTTIWTSGTCRSLFLLVILIRGGEWLLRRKWGVFVADSIAV